MLQSRQGPGNERTIKMSDNVTETQEMTVTLTVEQLEGIVRKVVREELKAFATKDFFNLDKANLRFMRIWKIFLNAKNPIG